MAPNRFSLLSWSVSIVMLPNSDAVLHEISANLNMPRMDRNVSNWGHMGRLEMIIFTSLCVLHSVLSSFIHPQRGLRVTHVGALPYNLWNYADEDTMFLLFTATRLEYSRAPFLTPLALQLPPTYLAGSPASALEERPQHYEKPLMSAWHGMLWCAAYYTHSSESGDTWQADSQQVV